MDAGTEISSCWSRLTFPTDLEASEEREILVSFSIDDFRSVSHGFEVRPPNFLLSNVLVVFTVLIDER